MIISKKAADTLFKINAKSLTNTAINNKKQKNLSKIVGFGHVTDHRTPIYVAPVAPSFLESTPLQPTKMIQDFKKL